MRRKSDDQRVPPGTRRFHLTELAVNVSLIGQHGHHVIGHVDVTWSSESRPLFFPSVCDEVHHSKARGVARIFFFGGGGYKVFLEGGLKLLNSRSDVIFTP